MREQVRLLGKMCAIMTPPEVVPAVMEFDARRRCPLAELFAGIDVPDVARRGAATWILYEALGVMVADGALRRRGTARGG